MEQWLNVGITGFAIWPTKEQTIDFGGYKLLLKPATRETEQSVHIDLQTGISSIDALTLINRFLSVLSWCDDQAMTNRYGWAGSPAPASISREIRATGSSIGFPFYRDLEKNKKARLALALFREGKSLGSTPFEFLSYFKILNIFWQDRFVGSKASRKNPIIEGIRNTLGALKDERSLHRLKQLQISQSDVPQYLYESGRCAIAHAYSDPIVDPDDVSELRRLSEDVYIIKEIAEYLIKTDLKVSKHITG